MTEEEWLKGDDPLPLLESLRSKASGRKCRLLACACCRAVWDCLDPEQRMAVGAAESFADGQSTPTDYVTATQRFSAGQNQSGYHQFFDAVSVGESPDRAIVLSCLVGCACGQPDDQAGPWAAAIDAVYVTRHPSPAAPGLVRGSLIRDVFGNPFNPAAVDPSWRTDAAVALARGMYESRDFGTMPLLADELVAAGCADVDILAHCRSERSHVRGCWVVDLVLGKE